MTDCVNAPETGREREKLPTTKRTVIPQNGTNVYCSTSKHFHSEWEGHSSAHSVTPSLCELLTFKQK